MTYYCAECFKPLNDPHEDNFVGGEVYCDEHLPEEHLPKDPDPEC